MRTPCVRARLRYATHTSTLRKMLTADNTPGLDSLAGCALRTLPSGYATRKNRRILRNAIRNAHIRVA